MTSIKLAQSVVLVGNTTARRLARLASSESISCNFLTLPFAQKGSKAEFVEEG